MAFLIEAYDYQNHEYEAQLCCNLPDFQFTRCMPVGQCLARRQGTYVATS
jgi:hypothetical protein